MEVDLDNWFKPKIEKKKLRELSQRRDLPGLLHFLFYFLFLFFAGYMAFITLGT